MDHVLGLCSVRMAVGTIAAGFLVLVSARVTGPDVRIAAFVAVAMATPVLVAIDITERRLPNRIVGVLGAVIVACVALRTLVAAPRELAIGELATAIVSGLATLAAYGGLALAGGLGMGDAKLAGVLAILLGSVSARAALAAAILPFLFAAPRALSLVWRQKTRRASIAFGPWLLAGFWASAAAFARVH